MPLDTRPRVGLTCRDVSHHAWTSEQFARDRLPSPACEAVWAEACFLMDRRGFDAAKALKMTERGVVPFPWRRIVAACRHRKASCSSRGLARGVIDARSSGVQSAGELGARHPAPSRSLPLDDDRLPHLDVSQAFAEARRRPRDHFVAGVVATERDQAQVIQQHELGLRLGHRDRLEGPVS
jgi:hypothetical protein